MATYIIIIALIVGIYSGARRGLILQLVYLLGYGISFYLAIRYYQIVAGHIEMYVPYPSFTPGTQFVLFDQIQALTLDKAFYRGISFVGILFIGWLVTRIIGYLLTELSYLPVLKQFNSLGGAILGFVLNYVGIFFLLSILTMIPFQQAQDVFANNSLAYVIVDKTPVLTKQVTKMWVESTTPSTADNASSEAATSSPATESSASTESTNQ